MSAGAALAVRGHAAHASASAATNFECQFACIIVDRLGIITAVMCLPKRTLETVKA